MPAYDPPTASSNRKRKPRWGKAPGSKLPRRKRGAGKALRAGTRHKPRLHPLRKSARGVGPKGAAARHVGRPHAKRIHKLKSPFNKFSTNPLDYFGQRSITPDKLSGHHKKKGET